MSFLDLLTTDTSNHARAQGRIFGVATGIVEDVKDPDNLGRIKVIFPWLAAEREETVHIAAGQKRAHSYWARVATLMAGKERGTFFIPEPGDEVLVAFEHGGVDRPVVIGTLWNKEDKPPAAMDADGKNDKRLIKTRSGHKIEFDDSSNAPSILIVDKTGNNSIRINSKENSLEIKVDGDLVITAGKKLRIKAAGITIESSAEVEIKADSNLKLQAQAEFSAKGNSAAKVEGAAQAELKGAMVSVNGSGVTEIKGGIVKIN
jgi:uncharacterized protein involved in type VI secretion and phage assembly